MGLLKPWLLIRGGGCGGPKFPALAKLDIQTPAGMAWQGGLGDRPFITELFILDPMVNDLWMLFNAECKSRTGWPTALMLS